MLEPQAGLVRADRRSGSLGGHHPLLPGQDGSVRAEKGPSACPPPERRRRRRPEDEKSGGVTGKTWGGVTRETR